MTNDPLSRRKLTKKSPFYGFNFGKVDVFSHKKKLHVMQVIRSLAILGASNTWSIATYVIQKTVNTDIRAPLKKRDLNGYYKDIIIGNREKTKGGKKQISKKRFSGLINEDYVVKTGLVKQEKNIDATKPLYFLTLKGIFLALGFSYDANELKQIIENFSKISIYFGFLRNIMNQTSVDLVDEIFVEPLIDVLKQSNIFEGENTEFYFTNIAEFTSRALSNKIKKILNDRITDIKNKPLKYFYDKITDEDKKEYPNATMKKLIWYKIGDEIDDQQNLLEYLKKTGIITIMNNVFYYDKPPKDWKDSLIEHLYTKKDTSMLDLLYHPELDRINFSYHPDTDLLYKVMKELHFTFYNSLNWEILRIPRKPFKRSKKWIRHKKFKNLAKRELKTLENGSITASELYKHKKSE